MNNILLFACSALLVGLSSCSDNDSEENTGTTGGGYSRKALSRIEIFDYKDNLKSKETFLYDDKGRWIGSDRSSYYTPDPEEHLSKSTVLYSDNQIKLKLQDDLTNSYTRDYRYEVKDNLIVSWEEVRYEEGRYTYVYSDGYLTEKRGSHYEYNNGNLVEIAGKSFSYDITYTDIPNKTGFGELNNLDPLYINGYFGKSSKNLIKSTLSDSGDKNNYSYVLDKGGYVTEILKERERYPESTLKYKIYYK